MREPGWAQNVVTTTATATGTTGLTLARPTGTVDHDILVMGLSHKGVGWATVPAGWTLIGRDVEATSGLRGEAYWKRASSEGATYAITDLADTAAGAIKRYPGGLRVGSVVDAVAVRANLWPASGTGALTVSVPNALLVMVAAGSNTQSMGTPGTGGDIELSSLIACASVTTTNGTDCRLSMADGLKRTPSTLAGFTLSATPATMVGNVCIACALIPDTTTSLGDGTRYYPTLTSTGMRVDELAAGAWDNSYFSAPRVASTSGNTWTHRLSQDKAGGGLLAQRLFTTNQTGESLLIARGFSPPLEAQTIAGTFDLTFMVGAVWTDSGSGFAVDTAIIRYRLHLYISVGQTGQVRHTLLDNHTDSVNWPVSTAATRLAAPIPLTAGDCLAGDSVVIEWGAQVVSIPTPLPTYPPTEFGRGDVRHGGTASSSGVPWIDVALGQFVSACGYFDFSQTLLERASEASAPTNLTPETAIAIDTWPYDSPWFDTTLATTSPARGVWFTFTAPETRRCFLFLGGTNYLADIDVYRAEDLENTTGDVIRIEGGLTPQRCDLLCILDAVEAQTYVVRVRDDSGRHCSGGALHLRHSWYAAPEEDDLYVPAATIYAIRDGHIVNADPTWRDYATTGVRIDYSGLALPDYNHADYPTPTHTAHRLVLALHNLDLVEVLDLATLNVGEDEVNFFSDVLDATGGADTTGVQQMSSLELARDGTVHVACFGDGYLRVNGGSSWLEAAYYDAPASDPYMTAFRSFPVTATDDADPPPASPTSVWIGENAPLAPWRIALAPDGETLFYVAGGFYTDEALIGPTLTDLRASVIKRFNIASGLQLADFATVPLATGPREGLYGLALHPAGDVLVCNGTRIDRLNSAGTVVQSYQPTPAPKSRSLVDVVYTADGAQFWAFDQGTATLFRMAIVDGELLETVDTYFWPLVTTQMAIYQADGVATPPAELDDCEPVRPSAGCWGVIATALGCAVPIVGPPAAGGWTDAPPTPSAGCADPLSDSPSADGWAPTFDPDDITVRLTE